MSEQTANANHARLHVIDSIRGLAVFGILLANVWSWSGYKFIPFETIATLPLYSLDSLFLQLHYFLVDGKFYAIFSMLFGAGFGLQLERKRDNEPAFIRIYRRRITFLLLFGLAHAFFWSGDILTLYALLAFVLVGLRGLSVEQSLWAAILLLGFFLVPQLIAATTFAEVAAHAKVAHKTYPDMTPDELRAAFALGGWPEVITANVHNLYWRIVDYFPNGRISRVLGFFMLGFYLARSNYFVTGIYSGKRLLVFLLLGISATGWALAMDTNITRWATSVSEVAMKAVLVLGQVCLALAYMSMLARVFRSPLGATATRPLALIGRMAFTCYLMQTVIGITLFYGVGFGYWGTVGLAQLWLLAALIFAFQVAFCALWFRYYRKGPVEWFWACLTAGQLSPNRK